MQNEPEKLQLLVSPWTGAFEVFARSITKSALIVTPYVTAEPLQRMSRHLKSRKRPKIEILTDLAVESMLQGSTSPEALVDFCGDIPSTEIRHLPGLHAKVYVADEREAIVTSANFTRGGLAANYEYGVRISDPPVVRQILDDLEGYAALGAEVPPLQLTQLADIAIRLKRQHSQVLASARRSLRDAFHEQMEAAQETLLELRAKSSQSTNAIFSRTILYLLKRGPLSTRELHPLIQKIHPDICDDTIDRVIQGVRFGKRWKHMVRNAQQSLKQQGLISFDNGRWSLTTPSLDLETTL